MQRIPRQYKPMSVVLHWLSFILVVTAFAAGELRHVLVDARLISMRSIMTLHIGSGMVLLVSVVPRLLARVIHPQPEPTDHLNRAITLAAKLTHLTLYVLLIVVPLLGWTIVNAKGMRVPMPFTGLEFPALVPPNRAIVATLVPLHETLARVFYAVIVLHVGAAAWHHLIMRDETLSRMSLVRGAHKRATSVNPNITTSSGTQCVR